MIKFWLGKDCFLLSVRKQESEVGSHQGVEVSKPVGGVPVQRPSHYMAPHRDGKVSPHTVA